RRSLPRRRAGDRTQTPLADDPRRGERLQLPDRALPAAAAGRPGVWSGTGGHGGRRARRHPEDRHAGDSVRRLRSFAPAGIGNFAAGFDVLGAAVAPEDGSLWGDLVEITESEETRLVCGGPFAGQLPIEPDDNLVLRTRDLFEEAIGRALPPLQLTLHKGLPVCSGLGSSAASVAATARALNAWCGDPLSPGELLTVAGRAEGLASGA